MTILLQLLALHFLCDFPLQGDFLARGKNHRNPLPGVPPFLCLFAHCMIHAGAYSLVVPWPSALVVGAVHMLVDWSKCAGFLGEGESAFLLDQSIHIVVLVALAGAVVP